MLELYIVLSEDKLRQWMTRGSVPPSHIVNGTDERHSWYNFHEKIEYAVSEFLNIYLYTILQITAQQPDIY
eukprot:6488672-Amphidinium_carterae.2